MNTSSIKYVIRHIPSQHYLKTSRKGPQPKPSFFEELSGKTRTFNRKCDANAIVNLFNEDWYNRYPGKYEVVECRLVPIE